ncbi:DNA polymerase III subunit beta [Irregularibacter muris]|uniref:Beta sliding clamp n=1 Tax=Irregularibacter muris TaxID=1796619 RepID=A0AAE3HIJ2_9FIRM|nr:DNA polymerase III subunit beta [Irregularibacter muris]MCR1899243.1 DNA polymerase III subunit beta [Irregularibacter muris]
MNIKCSKNQLLEGVVTVQKAVSSRTTLPILEGIFIQAEENKIKLVATDLEIGIESYIEGEIIEEGSVVLSSRIISELIRKLPEAPVEIKSDEANKTWITCASSEFVIQGQSGLEFPDLPEVSDESFTEIPQDLFKNMIRQTIFSVAQDETRPILTGALLEVDEKAVSLAALDGYRLALRKGKTSGAGNDKIREVIPGRTLNEISKILSEEENMIQISHTGNQILFQFGNTRIISRLLEGEFINYNQIIPEEYKTKIKVKTKDLLDSCERAALLARQGKNNLIKMEIQGEQMVISSNAEIGQVHEEITIEIGGEELTIAFNSKYFIDALKIIEDEEIILEFTTSVSPCVIKPIEEDYFVYLILPVRLLEH